MIYEVTLQIEASEDLEDEALESYVIGSLRVFGCSYRPPGWDGDEDPGDPVFGMHPTRVLSITRCPGLRVDGSWPKDQ